MIKTVEWLLRKHKSYSVDTMFQNEALYEGGAKMAELKPSILIKREIELNPGGENVFSARLNCAFYENIIAGIINLLTSASTREPVQIKYDGPDSKRAYYEGLNKDINFIVRKTITKTNLHKRGYLAAYFPVIDNVKSGEEEIALGTKDASIVSLDGWIVTDWKLNFKGVPEWIKTYSVRLDDENPFGEHDMLIHCVNVWTKEAITEFEWKTKIDPKGKPIFDEKEVVTGIERTNTSHGYIPIVPIDFGCGEMIDSLSEIAISLYNATAALKYLQLTGCIQQSCFKTPDKKVGSLFLGESVTLKLGLDEDFKYVGPDMAHVASQAAECDRLVKSMYEAIQGGALKSQMTDQNMSRLSGDARFHEFGNLSALLQNFADGIISALTQVLEIIKNVRGDDDVTLTVTGMDKFDVLDTANEIDQVQKIISMGISETLDKYLKYKVAEPFLIDAPAEIRAKIEDELNNPAPEAKPKEIEVEAKEIKTEEKQEKIESNI